MKAPMAPPKSIYFGSTFFNSIKLLRSVIPHAAKQTINAVNCTNAPATQMLVRSVTSVLNTP